MDNGSITHNSFFQASVKKPGTCTICTPWLNQWDALKCRTEYWSNWETTRPVPAMVDEPWNTIVCPNWFDHINLIWGCWLGCLLLWWRWDALLVGLPSPFWHKRCWDQQLAALSLIVMLYSVSLHHFNLPWDVEPTVGCLWWKWDYVGGLITFWALLNPACSRRQKTWPFAALKEMWWCWWLDSSHPFNLPWDIEPTICCSEGDVMMLVVGFYSPFQPSLRYWTWPFAALKEMWWCWWLDSIHPFNLPWDDEPDHLLLWRRCDVGGWNWIPFTLSTFLEMMNLTICCSEGDVMMLVVGF
jgi:hypothetical protein